MDISVIAIVITVAVGASASVLANILDVIGLTTRLLDKDDSTESTEEKIERLTDSLREATELISRIETDIVERQELAENLQEDIKAYDEIVQLKKPEVEAITRILEGERSKREWKSLLREIAVETVFFMLGAGFALLVT